MGGRSAPSMPPPPPPAPPPLPVETTPEVVEAKTRTSRRAQSRRGRASTILTGPQGLDDSLATAPTLLGA